MRLKAVGTALELIAIAAILALLVLNLTGRVMFAVVEGKSMEPLLQTGDLVLVVKTLPQDIHVGDIVVYRSPYGELVIHRVIRVEHEGGHYVYLIKGDNNAIPDGNIPYSWIIGKVVGIGGSVFKLPVIGYLTLSFKSMLK